jgi:TetR/AcrR family transcriptional regulator, cholesterol catabolism regulator
MARAARQTARQEAGRQEILAAAATLLATYGYHGMAMRDLAKGAGMSLANLYNYFGSKEDLVFELQTRAFETLVTTAERALAPVERPEERLYAFILNHVRYVSAHGDVMRVLVEEAGEVPAERRQAIRALKERYFAIGRATVRAVADAGCGVPGTVPLGSSDEKEIERSTYNIFGMLNWVYAWHRPDRHGDAPEIARSILRLSLCGLVATCPTSSELAATERQVAGVRVLSPVSVNRGEVA